MNIHVVVPAASNDSFCFRHNNDGRYWLKCKHMQK